MVLVPRYLDSTVNFVMKHTIHRPEQLIVRFFVFLFLAAALSRELLDIQ